MANADHSLFVWKSVTEIVFVTIYVDDLIIRGEQIVDTNHIKGLLIQEFTMKNLGGL